MLSFLEEVYGQVGWSKDLAEHDLKIMKKCMIDSIEMLTKTLERGYHIPLPPVALDLLRGESYFAPLEKIYGANVLAAAVHGDAKLVNALREERIFDTRVLSKISKDTWKKLLIPAGWKVKIEDLLFDRDVLKKLEVSPLEEEEQRRSFLPIVELSSELKNYSLSERMTVTFNGQSYEVDRYCPHKQYDLKNAPISEEGLLECPKHKWRFDLSQSGVCINGKKPCSLNATKLNNW